MVLLMSWSGSRPLSLSQRLCRQPPPSVRRTDGQVPPARGPVVGEPLVSCGGRVARVDLPEGVTASWSYGSLWARSGGPVYKPIRFLFSGAFRTLLTDKSIGR